MPTDEGYEPDLPPLSKLFAASRVLFAPTEMTASADDYARTLKDWPRRLRAHPVQIEAKPRGPKLLRAVEDYVRTSIVGLRPRRVGTA